MRDHSRSDGNRSGTAAVEREAPVPGKRTLVEDTFERPAIQLKKVGAASSVDLHATARTGVSGAGAALPYLAQIQRSFGRHDITGVVAHTGEEAAQASDELGAAAYATGNRVAFGRAPDLYTAAHEAAHIVQQRAGARPSGGVGQAGDAYEQHADAVAARVVAGQSAEDLLDEMVAGNPHTESAAGAVQRREVATDAEIRGPQDWTEADREQSTQRWKNACLHNLNAVDSSQYRKVVERRDFYRWFYEHTAALGYTTRWALAAHVVANGAHQIADMDEAHETANDALGMANVELQGAMREGNQVIFDNVLPKLKRLLDGGPLRGAAALRWDMQVLAEEQTLIQPMYARMSPQTRAQLDYIARKRRFAGLGAWMTGEDRVPAGPYNNAGRVPGFNQPDLQTIGDRWRYGMELGNQFTPGGTGFDPSVHGMPSVSSGYADGSEFARVDTRRYLHQLDAWLNPNRLSRVRGDSGSSIQGILDGLTTFEKQQVLADRSPDGWAYSTQFAQFSFITEQQVRQALPSDPASASAVSAFLDRYRAEARRVQLRYPTTVPMVPFGF